MIISDLAYLEVVEETSIIGGNLGITFPPLIPSASADAGAAATALGKQTATVTFTDSQVAAGVGSSSTSGSSARVIG